MIEIAFKYVFNDFFFCQIRKDFNLYEFDSNKAFYFRSIIFYLKKTHIGENEWYEKDIFLLDNNKIFGQMEMYINIFKLFFFMLNNSLYFFFLGLFMML